MPSCAPLGRRGTPSSAVPAVLGIGLFAGSGVRSPGDVVGRSSLRPSVGRKGGQRIEERDVDEVHTSRVDKAESPRVRHEGE
ncbi:MAG TPA: hypothetical protein VFC31_00035 [Candidatus Limnocylindria bacterium]|nr:hypothetical protein [Candidatus Limnocylindria bacterium]